MELPARIQLLISHLWIAAFVVETAGTAALIRVMRANLLDELNNPYVVTASAKKMPAWKLILKYPGWLALNSLVTTLGYLLPVLMSGSVIVSVVLILRTETRSFCERCWSRTCSCRLPLCCYWHADRKSNVVFGHTI